ncbi:uncharacterized protein [Vicugna pacos]|uniref:Translation initiation factor IF-2-like n=1 Tax=Vicugna pacos TaxID=30538 RepID=A0ABM5CGB0_VICPA
MGRRVRRGGSAGARRDSVTLGPAGSRLRRRAPQIPLLPSPGPPPAPLPRLPAAASSSSSSSSASFRRPHAGPASRCPRRAQPPGAPAAGGRGGGGAAAAAAAARARYLPALAGRSRSGARARLRPGRRRAAAQRAGRKRKCPAAGARRSPVRPARAAREAPGRPQPLLGPPRAPAAGAPLWARPTAAAAASRRRAAIPRGSRPRAHGCRAERGPRRAGPDPEERLRTGRGHVFVFLFKPAAPKGAAAGLRASSVLPGRATRGRQGVGAGGQPGGGGAGLLCSGTGSFRDSAPARRVSGGTRAKCVTAPRPTLRAPLCTLSGHY